MAHQRQSWCPPPWRLCGVLSPSRGKGRRASLRGPRAAGLAMDAGRQDSGLLPESRGTGAEEGQDVRLTT